MFVTTREGLLGTLCISRRYPSPGTPPLLANSAQHCTASWNSTFTTRFLERKRGKFMGSPFSTLWQAIKKHLPKELGELIELLLTTFAVESVVRQLFEKYLPHNALTEQQRQAYHASFDDMVQDLEDENAFWAECIRQWMYRLHTDHSRWAAHVKLGITKKGLTETGQLDKNYQGYKYALEYLRDIARASSDPSPAGDNDRTNKAATLGLLLLDESRYWDVRAMEGLKRAWDAVIAAFVIIGGGLVKVISAPVKALVKYVQHIQAAGFSGFVTGIKVLWNEFLEFLVQVFLVIAAVLEVLAIGLLIALAIVGVLFISGAGSIVLVVHCAANGYVAWTIITVLVTAAFMIIPKTLASMFGVKWMKGAFEGASWFLLAALLLSIATRVFEKSILSVETTMLVMVVIILVGAVRAIPENETVQAPAATAPAPVRVQAPAPTVPATPAPGNPGTPATGGRP